MRKKTLKKNAPYEEFCAEKEEWDKLTPQERDRIIRKREMAGSRRRNRRARYNEGPLKSVRGISKVRRNCSYVGRGNGMLCVACMRRGHMSKEGTCSACGSTSTCYIGPKARLPGRKSTKQHWKRFLKKHVQAFKHMTEETRCSDIWYETMGNDGRYVFRTWPDDFMANM